MSDGWFAGHFPRMAIRVVSGGQVGIVSGRWLPSATHWTRPSRRDCLLYRGVVRWQTPVVVAAFSCPT